MLWIIMMLFDPSIWLKCQVSPEFYIKLCPSNKKLYSCPVAVFLKHSCFDSSSISSRHLIWSRLFAVIKTFSCYKLPSSRNLIEVILYDYSSMIHIMWPIIYWSYLSHIWWYGLYLGIVNCKISWVESDFAAKYCFDLTPIIVTMTAPSSNPTEDISKSAEQKL